LRDGWDEPEERCTGEGWRLLPEFERGNARRVLLGFGRMERGSASALDADLELTDVARATPAPFETETRRPPSFARETDAVRRTPGAGAAGAAAGAGGDTIAGGVSVAPEPPEQHDDGAPTGDGWRGTACPPLGVMGDRASVVGDNVCGPGPVGEVLEQQPPTVLVSGS
jgi:hypothetical protein